MGSRKIISALIALVALGACASTASADPLSMTFTEARANVGKQLSDAALFALPDTAPFAAQIDPASGSISNGTLGVPDFETHIEEPIKADVTIDFDIGQITGSFDQGDRRAQPQRRGEWDPYGDEQPHVRRGAVHRDG